MCTVYAQKRVLGNPDWTDVREFVRKTLQEETACRCQIAWSIFVRTHELFFSSSSRRRIGFVAIRRRRIDLFTTRRAQNWIWEKRKKKPKRSDGRRPRTHSSCSDVVDVLFFARMSAREIRNKKGFERACVIIFLVRIRSIYIWTLRLQSRETGGGSTDVYYFYARAAAALCFLLLLHARRTQHPCALYPVGSRPSEWKKKIINPVSASSVVTSLSFRALWKHAFLAVHRFGSRFTRSTVVRVYACTHYFPWNAARRRKRRKKQHALVVDSGTLSYVNTPHTYLFCRPNRTAAPILPRDSDTAFVRDLIIIFNNITTVHGRHSVGFHLHVSFAPATERHFICVWPTTYLREIRTPLCRVKRKHPLITSVSFVWDLFFRLF